MPINFLSRSSATEGLLRIRVINGNDLPKHDMSHSDPYVVVTVGKQKEKTVVWTDNSNPIWNEEFNFSLKDPNVPIILTVYDKDSFTRDDKMGDAELDIKPLLDCSKMGLEGLPNGTKVGSVQPSKGNCLAGQSYIVWKNGKLTQHMTLKLRNVERGELEIQVEWLGRSS